MHLSTNYSRMMHKHSSAKQTKVSVSIVGARGYAGLELARLLLRHPNVSLTHCFATRDFALADDVLDPKAAAVSCLKDGQLMENLTDVVFLATPAEVSAELAP